MIASLPMYDRPETAAANDQLWQAIRARLGFGPDALTRGGDVWKDWQSPDLVLSQTCGYPYRARLHGKVALVGTPDYGLPDCPPGHYCSVFIARKDDPRGTFSEFADARFAFNEALSQSGWAAPQIHAAELGFSFSNPQASGGHWHSAKAVATGGADVAAIDALTWRNIQRFDGFSTDLRVITQTTPTPVLPYITALGRDTDAILSAVAGAIGDLPDESRDVLSLRGVVKIPAAAYLAVPNPAPPPQ